MKVIRFNRRKLSTFLIIVGLMFMLLALEKGFHGKLTFVSLLQNNITTLKEYKGLDGKITYKLPAKWTSKERDFKSEEIVYHNEFTSQDSVINGFVQVWNIKGDLKGFLDRSKKISMEQNEVKDYKIAPLKINKYEGYSISYLIHIRNSTDWYKVYEYFMRVPNGFVRFSFFAKENMFKENFPTIFTTIIETLKYSN